MDPVKNNQGAKGLKGLCEVFLVLRQKVNNARYGLKEIGSFFSNFL